MEAFLAKELGGRFQAIGDDVKNSSAIILEGEELIDGIQGNRPLKKTPDRCYDDSKKLPANS